MQKFDNYLLIGNLNSEIQEPAIKEFCETYNLDNLINEPTCYKNPLNPSSIDVMLTNRPKRFYASQAIETCLSDHKLTVTVFQKQRPISIKYRDYKKFDQTKFHKQLVDEINTREITYEEFGNILIKLLEIHAPTKEKNVRAKQRPIYE